MFWMTALQIVHITKFTDVDTMKNIVYKIEFDPGIKSKIDFLAYVRVLEYLKFPVIASIPEFNSILNELIREKMGLSNHERLFNSDT